VNPTPPAVRNYGKIAGYYGQAESWVLSQDKAKVVKKGKGGGARPQSIFEKYKSRKEPAPASSSSSNYNYESDEGEG